MSLKIFIKKIEALKETYGRDIWLVVGGGLTTILLNRNLIDEMQIAIVPTILGDGLSLFSSKPKTAKWTLV